MSLMACCISDIDSLQALDDFCGFPYSHIIACLLARYLITRLQRVFPSLTHRPNSTESLNNDIHPADNLTSTSPR